MYLQKELFPSEKDVATISQELKDVEDWQGLALWLDIESSIIESNCMREVAIAECHRRKLVQCYCNTQPHGNPSKIVEDIAKALANMGYKMQAKKLRKLQFGK